MSKFLELKQQRDAKHHSASLIKNHIQVYQDEINLREFAIKQMIEAVKKLQDEAQEIADQMLEIEYLSQK